MTITSGDKSHLRRCMELAAEAVERGDDPFGSLLVGADGTVLSGEQIRELAGPDATTIDLGAREVVRRSNVEVQVDGPCEELVDEAGELFGGK